MRFKIGFAVCLFVVCSIAEADAITRVSPTTLRLGNVEEFLTLFGSGLKGTSSTLVVINGPAGSFTLEPNSLAEDGSVLVTWIPVEVAVTAGRYAVNVHAADATATRIIGPVHFTVEEEPVVVGPPFIDAPETFFAEATSLDGAIVQYGIGGQSQDGTPTSVSCSPPSGSNFAFGTTHVTCTTSDGFGSATAQFLLIVGDTTAPVLTLPADIVSEPAQVSFEASAVDNLDGALPVTCNPASGSTFPTGKTTVICATQDSHLNPANGTFTVTVTSGAPLLELPPSFAVEATSASGAVATYAASATGGNVSCAPASGSQFPIAVTTVLCSATNQYGTTNGSFQITVQDTTPPALSVPNNITAEATSANGAVVTYSATATDVVDGARNVVCSRASGSTFGFGTTTVECTSSDSRGNADGGSFDVTVVDTRPPVLTLPADFTVEAESAAGAVVTYSASASDAVDGSVAVTCAPPSGSTFAMGGTTVNCTAKDSRNNRANGSFGVTVADTIPPTITAVSATPSTLWPPDHKMVAVTVTVTAQDSVDPAPVTRIVSVSSDQPTEGTGDGDTPVDWKITGPLMVDLRAERSANKDRTYTITVEAVDASGNTATATTTVVVTSKKK